MKPNLLFQTNFIQQNRGSFFENMIDNRYPSCYTLDMFIANHIITRTSLPEKDAGDPNSTPLINDGCEANKHQHPSYPMVI